MHRRNYKVNYTPNDQAREDSTVKRPLWVCERVPLKSELDKTKHRIDESDAPISDVSPVLTSGTYRSSTRTGGFTNFVTHPHDTCEYPGWNQHTKNAPVPANKGPIETDRLEANTVRAVGIADNQSPEEANASKLLT